MDPHEHDRALSADLAALVSVSGRLLTLIRARCRDAAGDPTKADAAIEEIRSWSDAAHNLSGFGHLIRSGLSGEEAGRLPDEARRLARALRAEADRCAAGAPLVADAFREAADLINGAAGHAGKGRGGERSAPATRLTRWACAINGLPLTCRIEHGHFDPETRVESVPVRTETVLLSIRAEGLLPADADSGDLANFWNYARIVNRLTEGGPLLIRNALEQVADDLLREVSEDLRRLPLHRARAAVTLSRGELIPGAQILIRAETDDPY